MISYLQGTAQQWFTPNLYNLTSVLAWDRNFPVFVQELTLNFRPVISVHTHLALSLVFVSSARLNQPLFRFSGNRSNWLLLRTGFYAMKDY
jgi:hypothetical protein